MSIQSVLYNGATQFKNNIEGGLQGVSSRLETTLEAAQATIGSLWDGGFVGIAGDTSPLSTAITSHIAKLEGTINGFGSEGDVEVAYKGEAATATHEYVQAVKELVAAYVSTYKQFNEDLTNAAAAMKEGDTVNAAGINQEAASVRQEAANIRVD